MKIEFKSFLKTIFSIIVVSIFLIENGCKVDATNQFNDNIKIEENILEFQKEIKAENHKMQMGIESKNGEKASVLRFTFDNVKINLMDSTLAQKSKSLMKNIYQEVKDKNQFDKYIVLLNKDPNFKEEMNGNNFSFPLNQINHSFSKEDLE